MDRSNSYLEHWRTAARGAHSSQTAFAACKTTSLPTDRNEPAYIARLTAEHGPIELLLGALAHSGEGRAFISDGLRRLQDHIFTDEQDAYPFAFQTLPPG